MGLGALLADWLHIGAGPCLTRHDAKVWATAMDLPDLGRLTAMYLVGDLESRPGQYGPASADNFEAEAPGSTDALVASNLAGFVTSDAMPGLDDGRWEQRAAVTGYASNETLAWLLDSMAGTPFEVRMWKHATSLRARIGWSRPDEDSCWVSRFDGDIVTDYGRRTAEAVEDTFDGSDDEAVAAAVDAWQVTVYDPEPGRNDLWQALHEAAEHRLDYLSSPD